LQALPFVPLPGQERIVAALPTIIRELKKQGYGFATVGDLVVSDPPTASDMSVDGKGVSE
jgi:peptidoglycan/xylan/chitin deacetylase (PgdA/CDA1 family)